MRSKLFVAVAALAVALTCLPESASAAPGARGFGVRAGVAGGFRGGPRGGILRNIARNLLFGQRNVVQERVIVNQFVQPQVFQAQAFAAQVVVPQVSQVVIPTVATVGVAQFQAQAVQVDGCAGAGFNAAVYGGGFNGRVFGGRPARFGARATCR